MATWEDYRTGVYLDSQEKTEEILTFLVLNRIPHSFTCQKIYLPISGKIKLMYHISTSTENKELQALITNNYEALNIEYTVRISTLSNIISDMGCGYD
ncbi:MAG: hypothetical protein [Methanosarcina spindle-shaped virus 1]